MEIHACALAGCAPVSMSSCETIWSRLQTIDKTHFSRGLPPSSARMPSKLARREKGIWQRRYWEHVIRDETDLERHVDYIHFNPVKHGLVSRVSDWPYSSFHRYVGRGILTADYGGGIKGIGGRFGE